jgi:hypothetical protein
MANDYYNTQIRNTKEPSSGGGVKPKAAGNQKFTITESHPSWPGLPGKAGPDRSNGTPEEKVYAYAQGIRGATETADDDDATSGGGGDKTSRNPMGKKTT